MAHILVIDESLQRAVEIRTGLSALQEKLKCGTSCGSCVPEIKRMLAMPQAA